MATTLSSTASVVKVGCELDLVRAGLGNVPDPVSFTYAGTANANGTAAGQCDRRYVAQLSIVAAGSTTLNLSSLLDPFGSTFAFLRLKQIYVELTKATAAASILIGGGTNAFGAWLIPAGTAQLRVRNGMCEFLGDCQDATGYVVVPSTGDLLKLTNEDGALAGTVNLELLGCSA
jgi:hypothetical protein